MLSEEVIKGLEENRKRRLSGDVVAIPYPYPRLSEYLPGIEQKKYYIVTSAQKGAKCFGKGTKILMSNGVIKNIEDIKIGDKVIGPDNIEKEVLNIGSGRQEMFQINQKFGDSFSVNKDHILYLAKFKDKECRKSEFINYCTLSVEEFLNLPINTQKRYRQVKSDIVEFKNSNNISIDPYFIGLWYGDGSVKELRITNIDKEIINYLEDFADNNNLNIKQCGTNLISYYLSDIFYISCYHKDNPKTCWIFNSNKEIIKYFDLGKINENSKIVYSRPKVSDYIFKRRGQKGKFKNIFFSYIPKNKEFIPEFIKTGSIETRRKFLSGFIDSDGYRTKNRTYEITQKRKQLINDLKFICDSLGLRTSIKSEFINRKEYFTLRLYGSEVFNLPIKVDRKKPIKYKARGSEKFRKFDIVPIGSGDYYGITLDGDHLFLLKDGTIVHNTQYTDFTFVFSIVDWYIENKEKTNIKVKIKYFSLEISRELKILSAISYKLFKSYGIIISPQKLRSVFKSYILDEKILNIINSKEFKDWLHIFESIVEIHEDVRNPYGIYLNVKAYAESNGKYEMEKILWEDKGKVVEKEVIKRYIPNDPNEFVIVVTDHVSLLQPERGATLHQCISDFSSNYCLKFRDRFGYTVVNVQQQSADSQTSAYDFRGDLVINRVKPTPFGLGDNKLTARDCNIMFGLFYPFYYDIDNYNSINLNRIGNHHRELSILLNRDGICNLAIDLLFLGAANHFRELPSKMNENIYNKIEEYQKIEI
jgi:hypothetical protein